jgi:hypothetical protein
MSTLGRRIDRLEGPARAEARRRPPVAVRGLARSLGREHGRSVHDWVVGHQGGVTRCSCAHRHDRVCPRCIEGDDPPALVRAVWVLICGHVEHGTPVALPPAVARVYVGHPDAVPGLPCAGCGYLLPARGGRLAYAGACPVCGARTATPGMGARA